MRLTRKTVVALGVSGALTVMAGVSASAAVLDLPILGFGEAANEVGAPPHVIHRTVYDDHYVTATTAATAPKAQATATSGTPKAAPGTTAGTPAPDTATAAPAAPATAAPAAAAFAAASAPAPQSAPASTTPAVTEPPDTAPPATSGRPPVPAGCNEPEWDSEHQAWHCSNSEEEDDD